MPMTFRDALLDLCERTPGLSLRKIAEGAGVSYEQLKKLNQGKSSSTNVDDALKIAAWLGVSLEELVGDDAVQVRIEVAETYNALSPRERAMLRAAREADRESGQEEP